ncbi:MAG: TRAP transporter large permease subunit, partial [Geminicoccaceae bacterium]|nr:TRAP transporter large permease subunit [Geminicoccaceae bacterium]
MLGADEVRRLALEADRYRAPAARVLRAFVVARSRLAEDLLTRVAGLFGPRRGGLAVAVVLVGGLLAASTGIVGAT